MKNQKNKLSLDQFKSKVGDSKEALEAISGGILGACHDGPHPKGGGSCHVGYTGLL